MHDDMLGAFILSRFKVVGGVGRLRCSEFSWL